MKNHQALDIELFNEILKSRANSNETEINPTLLFAYKDSKKAKNELIDFHETVWDNEIEQIVANLKQVGVEEFTISSTSTNLLRTIATFERFGYKTAGMTEVNETYVDILTDKRGRIPAIKLMLSK